jgi:ribosomal protein L12E/L44/L45/RPP1/RPP2
MGLLDKLGIGGTKEEREARSIAKLQKKVVEKFGPPENRQGAIEELGALKSEAAVEALLTRFTVRVDPGITDDEEKAHTLALICDAEDAALPAIKRFIAGREEISWPLKALADLVPEFEVVKVLVETLRKSAGEYARVPEKKVLLLHAVGHHQSPEIIAAALPFLEDMDDEVVIAAAQAIAAQAAAPVAPAGAEGANPPAPADKAAAGPPAGSEAGREPLIQTFLRAHEQKNARVKAALAGLLAESPWDVKGYTPKVEAALPEGYKVDSKGRVTRKV